MKRLIYFFVLLVFVSSEVVAKNKDPEILAKIKPEAIQKRIEQNRMGEIIIKTQPGAKLRIQQLNHEFKFGTAIPNGLAESSEEPISEEERKKFLALIKDNFNYAVHENAIKWYDNEKEPGKVSYTVGDEIYDHMNALGIPMRGHCVYWAKDDFVQDWLKTLTNDELRMAIKNRAVSLINHYKGKIAEFDLNNEMLHGDFFRRRLGYGIISEMAWMVKAQNPDAKLYMNDYGILDIGYNAGPYVTQIENLLKNGVPIDGIGIQAHRTVNGTIDNTPYMVQRNLDRVSRLGLPIKITEALFVYDTDKKRASELNKLFPIYFAQENVEAILMWGVWEKGHWIPKSAMWKSDFTPTRQAKAYQKLVFGEWWTDERKKADKNGEVRLKGFYGDYQIVKDGQSTPFTLKKSDGRVEVSI